MSKKMLEAYNLIKNLKGVKDKKEIERLTDEILSVIDEDVFINALKVSIGIKSAVPEDKVIYDSINFGFGEDYGYLMPEDIRTEVKSLRQEGTSLETLITVEPIKADEGKRVYDLTAGITPLDTVDHGLNIPVVEQSDMVEVKFATQRKAGIVNATLELFSDADKVVMNWIKQWSAKKSRATRNKMIMDKIAEITLGAEVAAADVSTLRSAILTNLSDNYKETAIVLVNYVGFDYLDTLVDSNGEKILKDKVLFELYPVKVLPDNLLANAAGTISIIIGSLKEALVLYDREKMLIDINKKAGFFTDSVAMKLIEKLDVKEIDSDAIIKVLLTK